RWPPDFGLSDAGDGYLFIVSTIEHSLIPFEHGQPDVLDVQEADSDRHVDMHLLRIHADNVTDKAQTRLLDQFNDRYDVRHVEFGGPWLVVKRVAHHRTFTGD